MACKHTGVAGNCPRVGCGSLYSGLASTSRTNSAASRVAGIPAYGAANRPAVRAVLLCVMTWQPGIPITAANQQEWEVWKRTSKLDAQRWRRAHNRRIDYYPSKAALKIISSQCGHFEGGDYSSVINRMVEDAGDIPE